MFVRHFQGIADESKPGVARETRGIMPGQVFNEKMCILYKCVHVLNMYVRHTF